MKFVAIRHAILLVVLLAASVPPLAVAQEGKAEIKAASSVRDLLQSHVGKRVSIRLGDQDMEGIVTAVGAETVHLSKLSGKDFYDAVISIGKISAVSYKAR